MGIFFGIVAVVAILYFFRDVFFGPNGLALTRRLKAAWDFLWGRRR